MEPILTIDDLSVAVKELAQARDHLAQLKSEWSEMQAELEKAHAEFLAAMDAACAKANRLETQIRDAAYLMAHENGELRPHPAILTKNIRVPVYDPAKAVAWAISHNIHDMVSLQKRAYEKALLSGLASDMPGQVVDDFQVTIKSDLAPFTLG